MTVVYIDSLALLNFIINYLLLLTSARIGGITFRRPRIAGAALFGALYAAVVWLPVTAFLAGLFWKILSYAVIVFIAFGGLKPAKLARLALLFAATSFLLGGLVLALGMLAGTPSYGGIPYIPIDFKTLFLTAGLSYGVLALVFKHWGRHGTRETAEVSVKWDSRRISVKALLDSGHALTDPLSGSDVLILGMDAALPLLPPEAAALIDEALLRDPSAVMELMGSLGLGSRFRLIPFRSVGVDCGFLLAFRPDRVEIQGRVRVKCLIAISPTPIDAGAGIEALAAIE